MTLPPRDGIAATQAFAAKYYALVRSGGTFNLYNSLRLFYANGGGPCYVVSVGDYTDDGRAPGGVAIDAGKLTQGLTAIGAQAGPTMLAVPDAVLLQPDATPAHGLPVSAAFNALAQAMLAQCGALQDRVAILDVYGADALKPDPNGGVSNSALGYLAETFQNGVGNSSLGYGMAYFPFLQTTVVQPDEVDYRNFSIGKADQLALLQGILTDTAAQLYPDMSRPGAGPADNASPQYLQLKTMIAAIATTTDASAIAQLNQDLGVAIPLLRQMETVIATALNLLPPSGAIAGIYTLVDATRGVWTAPANMAPVAVTAPSVRLNDQQQGGLNVPVNGKAINAIRDFVGRGTLVWGARTLDANSNDYRYIPVRRTLIYVEQSIKGGARPVRLLAERQQHLDRRHRDDVELPAGFVAAGRPEGDSAKRRVLGFMRPRQHHDRSRYPRRHHDRAGHAGGDPAGRIHRPHLQAEDGRRGVTPSRGTMRSSPRCSAATAISSSSLPAFPIRF